MHEKASVSRPVTHLTQTGPRLSTDVIKATKLFAIEHDRSYGEIIEVALWHYLFCPRADSA